MSKKITLPNWATKAQGNALSANASTIEAKLDTMTQIMAANRVAKVTIRLNPAGSSYEVPTDETEIAEILDGARIIFSEQGVAADYEADITSLTDFSKTFTVYVTDASEYLYSTVGATLGKSSTTGYAVANTQIKLKSGDDITVDLTTHQVDGEIVEMCRIQPYTDTPSSLSATNPLRLGNSFLGTRITTSSGTVFNYGHYDSNGTDWNDQSLTKVRIYDLPADTGVKTERVISDGGSENAVDLDERLNCIKNMKLVNVKFTGDSASITDNPFVRYDQLWVKQEFTNLDLPIADADGNVESGKNIQPVLIMWYANTQVDASYHLHPLFERYERQDDGSYAVQQLTHGYIARYPIGNTQNIAIDGVTQTVARCKSGEGREYVCGNKYVTLARATPLNKCTITISADGEEDVVIEANSDSRAVSIAATPEISFLQWMSYLYFGVNVQGADSATDLDSNILAGISTSAVAATTNGATNALIEAGIWNGAVNTKAITNSIVFMGVEDGLWSSTGWYDMACTKVNKRTMITDENGTVTSNTADVALLFAQDKADYNPGSVDPNTEIVDDESDSFEAELTHAGYRKAQFELVQSDGYWFRAGVDDSEVLRDAFFPAKTQAQHGLNIGGCDYHWWGSMPNTIGNFSATTAYALGKFVLNGGKLYKCTTAHAAGAWSDDDFTLCTNATVQQRNYYMVAFGDYRGVGSRLGAFYIYAGNALTFSGGYVWRARLSLQPV